MLCRSRWVKLQIQLDWPPASKLELWLLKADWATRASGLDWRTAARTERPARTGSSWRQRWIWLPHSKPPAKSSLTQNSPLPSLRQLSHPTPHTHTPSYTGEHILIAAAAPAKTRRDVTLPQYGIVSAHATLFTTLVAVVPPDLFAITITITIDALPCDHPSIHPARTMRAGRMLAGGFAASHQQTVIRAVNDLLRS